MRIPDPVKAGPAIFLWLLAGVFLFSQVVRGQSTCAREVAEIEAYSKKVDRLIETSHNSSRRVFVTTSRDVENDSVGWREFKAGAADAGDAVNDNAWVWSGEGKIVRVKFTFQSESHDMVQFAMYYYREDGTLARISAQLNLSRGQTTIIRDQFYDRKGVLIRGSAKSCSLKGGREQKADKHFIPAPLPVYLTIDGLPFSGALAKE